MVKAGDTEIFSRLQKSFFFHKITNSNFIQQINNKNDILSADEVSAAFDKMTIKLFNNQSFILDKTLRVFVLAF